MFSPCAPMGGTTCAASAISAVRSASNRSAIWAIIGQTDRFVTRVKGPKSPAERVNISASKSGTGRAARRSASAPRSIQTMADEGLPFRSGSGTSVNGPPVRWISVETLSCGTGCVTAKASAFWP